MFVRPLRRLIGRPLAVSYFHTSPHCWATKKVLQRFKLADIGEGITECEIIKWSVKPSSVVQAFDPLCEVQSDKASVEITSPFDGVVKELLVKEGEIAKVGSGLCLIEVEEDESTLENADPAVLEPVDAPVSTPPPPPPVAPVSSETTKRILEHSSEETTTTSKRLHPLDPNYAPDSSSSHHHDVLAAPSVRHFARTNNVHLSKLAPGSGKGGRIEKKDVDAYLARGTEQLTKSTLAPPSKEDVVVELGRTRSTMWKAMVKSLEIPHFGYSTMLDLTELHAILPLLNAHIPSRYLPPPSSPLPPPAVNPSALYPAPNQGQVPESQQFTKLTYLPILLKTLSKAMVEWPLFRSSITPKSTDAPNAKESLTIRPGADISIALSTPTGLYTPTISRVESHSIYSLSAQLKHLSHLGRQVPSGLTPAEMPRRGGTLTVSNVGALGAGAFASPVLVPGGGVAIVAIGRASWVWDVDRGDGKGERRLKVGVSWSADHRVVEGAEMAAFMECWRGYVEVPQRLIADGV